VSDGRCTNNGGAKATLPGDKHIVIQPDSRRTQDKIKSIKELADILASLRANNKKIVHCHGVFDLLHIGHIRHFEQAKRLGDALVVTVTQDRYVDKGPYRPAFDEMYRAQAVAALECVDYVAINEWPTAVETIYRLQPDIYVKGAEYRRPDNEQSEGFSAETGAVRKAGGEVIFTDEVTFSSSTLINRYVRPFPQEVGEYLSRLSRDYSSEGIIHYLESVSNLRVLVIGEAVIDEYQFGDAIGRARKEPVIVFNRERTERYAGGSLVVANHVANFCHNTDLIALIGDYRTHEKFIRANLNQNITAKFYTKKDSPTIVKTRFVDITDNRKLFEVYDLKDTSLDKSRSRILASHLKRVLRQYDLVIVCDSGHGLFTEQVVRALGGAKYLAVNAQLNPGNMGFNTINKYQHANYVCLNENELRLATGYKYENINDVIKKRFEGTPTDKVIVTRGWRGCTIYSRGELLDVPALSDKVVDKVGAGDALLAVTSLLACTGAPIDVTGFVGNAAGGLATAYMGNKEYITKEKIYKFIKGLLR
jgi:rfaE bifunctional protein kinase chain/domain/rfaE bifunctional protein nucleotidyltransferase chain/domain